MDIPTPAVPVPPVVPVPQKKRAARPRAKAVPAAGEAGMESSASGPLKRGTDRLVENAGRAKRARKGAAWIEEARTYLLDGVSSPEWITCVERWFNLETASVTHERNPRMQGALSRPSELTDWHSNPKRSYQEATMPTVADREEFGVQWVVWWNAMQPKSRRSNEGGLPVPYTEAHGRDMISVKKTGDGGLVTVLVGLKWWAGERNEDWMKVVNDVAAVLGSSA